MNGRISRRNMFAVGGGLTAASLTALAGSAKAADAMSATEKANVKLVKAFCESWATKNPDPDRDMPKYLAAQCSARVLNDGPFLKSPEAVAALFKKYIGTGARFSVRFLGTWAQGHVVVTHRVDTMTTPGKPDQNYEMVGIFIVEHGKIEKWDDFTISET